MMRVTVGGGLIIAISFLAPAPVQAEKLAAKTERPAFDLTYVPADAMGVIAVRPNGILSDPAMRPIARMANEALMGMLPALRAVKPKLAIEEIEQVIVSLAITPNKGEPKGVHTLGWEPVMIRTAHDFDWPKSLRQIDPRMEEVRHQGQIYYKVTLQTFSAPRPGTIVYFAVPDKRTLVFLQGARCIALYTGKMDQLGKLGQRPRFAWDEDFRRVEQSLFAIALDNRWTKGLSAEQIGGGAGWNELAQHASTVVAGVDWKDGIDFRVFLSCKNPEVAKQAMRNVQKLVAGMGQLREGVFPANGPPEMHKIDPASLPPEIARKMQVWQDLLKNVRITRRESTACVHTTVKLNLAEVVKWFTAPMPSPQP